MGSRTSAELRSAPRRSLRRLAPTRVNRLVVPRHEIAPRDVEIAVVDKTAVALNQRGAIETIEFRDLVPGQSAAQVMRGMQVVEQEKRPKHPGVLAVRLPTSCSARCSAKERISARLTPGYTKHAT